MTIKVDPRSFVIGVLATVVLLVAMGVARRDQDPPTSKDDSLKGKLSAVEQRLFQKLTMPQPGRFQLRTSEEYAVILDTGTGQAWKHNLTGTNQTLFSPPKLEPAGD